VVRDRVRDRTRPGPPPTRTLPPPHGSSPFRSRVPPAVRARAFGELFVDRSPAGPRNGIRTRIPHTAGFGRGVRGVGEGVASVRRPGRSPPQVRGGKTPFARVCQRTSGRKRPHRTELQSRRGFRSALKTLRSHVLPLCRGPDTVVRGDRATVARCRGEDAGRRPLRARSVFLALGSRREDEGGVCRLPSPAVERRLANRIAVPSDNAAMFFPRSHLRANARPRGRRPSGRFVGRGADGPTAATRRLASFHNPGGVRAYPAACWQCERHGSRRVFRPRAVCFGDLRTYRAPPVDSTMSKPRRHPPDIRSGMRPRPASSTQGVHSSRWAGPGLQSKRRRPALTRPPPRLVPWSGNARAAA